MIFLSKKMQSIPEHEATLTRNVNKKMVENEHVKGFCGFAALRHFSLF